jgi:hypothetical protein
LLADDDDRPAHVSTVGGKPGEQGLAGFSGRLGAALGSDELCGITDESRQLFQLGDGERFFDQMPNVEFVGAELLREKLPRFDAAGSAGFPVELGRGHAASIVDQPMDRQRMEASSSRLP